CRCIQEPPTIYLARLSRGESGSSGNSARPDPNFLNVSRTTLSETLHFGSPFSRLLVWLISIASATMDKLSGTPCGYLLRTYSITAHCFAVGAACVAE